MSIVPLCEYRYDAVRKLADLRTKPRYTKSPVPITGLFGLLPTDLLDAVCIAVLRMDCRWFDAFTRTCKGVRHSVSFANVIEFLIRRHSCMLPGRTLLDKACSYTEHVKLKMRSRQELHALSSLLGVCAMHCANPNQACCRDQRRAFNNKKPGLRIDCSSAGIPQTHSLLCDAMDGCHTWRSDVAAPGGARILCGTPAGAVIRERNDVRLVTSRRADVFTPGRELASVHLATTAMAEERGAVVWAAAEGDRVAVCTRHSSHASRYTVKLWGAHGRTPLGEHTLEPETLGVPPVNVRTMCMCKGAVWLVLTRRVDFHDEEVRFVRVLFKAGEPATTLTLLEPEGRIIDNVSVASESGHVTFLETIRQDHEANTARIVVFDPDRAKTHRITEPFGVRVQGRGSNVLAIAPNGRVIVLLLRNGSEDGQVRNDPKMFIYQREGGAFSWEVRVSEALPHDVGSTSPDVADVSWGWNVSWGRNALKASPVVHTVFSPSGDMLLVLLSGDDEFRAPSPGIVAFNVEEALRTGHISGTGTKCNRLDSQTVPLQLVWSNGLFACTPADSGVVRVGLCPW